jgi:hypothetical protein
MQLLSNQERLTAARVNRRLLHAVSHSFSWRHAPLYQVQLGMDWNLPVLIQRSLIRLAPIAVDLVRFHSDRATAPTVEFIFAIPNVQAFRNIVGYHHNFSARFFNELLAHPSAMQLRQFCAYLRVSISTRAI